MSRIPGLTIVRNPMETYLIVREEDGDRELTATECEKLFALSQDNSSLLKALNGAAGYLKNAHIDLATGAPKKTAMATIAGGIKLVEAALAKAETGSLK